MACYIMILSFCVLQYICQQKGKNTLDWNVDKKKTFLEDDIVDVVHHRMTAHYKHFLMSLSWNNSNKKNT